MSPFVCSGWSSFFFPCARIPFSSKTFTLGCPRNVDAHLGRPTASPVLLAWSGAQPCGARRAQRLGRSGGQGQQRPRCHGPFRRSLLHHSAGCLSPRVIRWRYPLPLRAPLGGPLHHGLRLGHSRPEGRRDFLPSQRAAAVLDGQAAVPPFAHQHFALGGRVVATLPLELEPPVVVAHHPVVADGALALQPENPVQFRSARSAPVKVFWLRRRSCKSPVVFRQIFPGQIHVRVFVIAALLPP